LLWLLAAKKKKPQSLRHQSSKQLRLLQLLQLTLLLRPLRLLLTLLLPLRLPLRLLRLLLTLLRLLLLLRLLRSNQLRLKKPACGPVFLRLHTSNRGQSPNGKTGL